MNWEEDGLDHLPEAADARDPWAHDPTVCGTQECPGCYAAAYVPRRHTTLGQCESEDLAEMDALDEHLNRDFYASWDGREDEVEAGHPLRHDRPTDEEWLIGDIDNCEDLRNVIRPKAMSAPTRESWEDAADDGLREMRAALAAGKTVRGWQYGANLRVVTVERATSTDEGWWYLGQTVGGLPFSFTTYSIESHATVSDHTESGNG